MTRAAKASIQFKGVWCFSDIHWVSTESFTPAFQGKDLCFHKSISPR